MTNDATTGHRIVRFESADAATRAFGRLRLLERSKIGSHVMESMTGVGSALRFRTADATVDVAMVEAGHGLKIEAAASTPELVRSLVRDVGSFVADPERAAVRADLGSTGPTGSSRSGVEERAADLFGRTPSGPARAEALRLVVRCVDLTTLAGDDTPGRVRALCAEAVRPDPCDASVGPTAAVCVYPSLVTVVAELLTDTGVEVASVAGAFPSGLSSLRVKLDDINDALQSGATEIDVVLNRAAFLSGDHDLVKDELHQMRQAIRPKPMKVIVEIDELASPGAIREASLLSMDAAADWIKTSTGKTGVGATPAGVLTMAEAIVEHAERTGHEVGLKISGGVRTADDALGYLTIVREVLGDRWLSPDRLRFGASGLVGAVVADLAKTKPQNV